MNGKNANFYLLNIGIIVKGSSKQKLQDQGSTIPTLICITQMSSTGDLLIEI